MSDINYYNLIKNSDTSQYFSYLNNKYINLVGLKLKIFKLDKTATILDDVYGSEKNSRIYLPPFSINALYLTNPWISNLDVEPYEEVEQKIKMGVNFDNMVATLRDLKNKTNSEIFVEYGATLSIPAMEKIGNLIKIYINGTLTNTINLNSARTTSSLVTAFNNISNFTATYTGINDETSKIKDFELIKFQNDRLRIVIEDTTYHNITDVVEMGDILLTEKWRAYEVKAAAPGGDFGWNWANYIMEGELVELDILDGLPGNYRKLIEEHQYGLSKINKE